MKPMPSGIWRYAWQLIALFTIASVAVNSTISYIADQFRQADGGFVGQGWFLVLMAMVAGFMFLLGGLGLWNIRFAIESESRRRIGSLVDAMEALKGGIVSLDTKGWITGFNPSANSLAPAPLRKDIPLTEGFPCLSAEDAVALQDHTAACEIERDLPFSGGMRTLRFRSQPSEGVVLIMVSDVTAMQILARRHQQLARWQLIGRIARGVAHDFNNMLCVIVGHVSLASRAPPGSPAMRESLDMIRHEADKGGALAANLLNLGVWATAGHPTNDLADHVRRAVALLGPSLPVGWKIETGIADDFPTVALSGIQVEQLTLNLGLLAADTIGAPGVLRITAERPGSDHLHNVGSNYAAVLLFSASLPQASPATASPADNTVSTDEEGIVQSVVQTMLEGTGGTLNVLKGSDGSRIYRALLPFGVAQSGDSTDLLPEDKRLLLTHWNILSAGSPRHHHEVDQPLLAMGAKVDAQHDIVSVLARVETQAHLDLILLEKNLLGSQAHGLLKAIRKLCPQTGLIVFCENPLELAPDRPSDVVFAAKTDNVSHFLTALFEAKALANRQLS